MRVRRVNERYIVSCAERVNLKGFRLCGVPFLLSGYTDLGINNVETYKILNLSK